MSRYACMQAGGKRMAVCNARKSLDASGRQTRFQKGEKYDRPFNQKLTYLIHCAARDLYTHVSCAF